MLTTEKAAFIDLPYIADLRINYQPKVREVHEDAPNVYRNLKGCVKDTNLGGARGWRWDKETCFW